ncbi:hypothetical protein llap_12440 [Limosa lapponica baueri]|uniref:Uncharacterized protein n=1 Tax=Limosa lapponica baueri TaxID=1758121 RepID=A0A2I0TTY2_LIMLA|nr:hypothetical protein llap_12440 [Limosa lapponica baueri]
MRPRRILICYESVAFPGRAVLICPRFRKPGLKYFVTDLTTTLKGVECAVCSYQELVTNSDACNKESQCRLVSCRLNGIAKLLPALRSVSGHSDYVSKTHPLK